MKTNIFRVKEKKEKKIIIEEERTKNPFLLFLKRHKNFLLLSLIMFLICLFLISTGVAFSLFRGSNDYDISYIEGSEEINANNQPDIDDDDIKEDLLGEIAREDGVVILIETFMSPQGDVISYYSDKTAVVVQANGKIYRISSNEKGEYGINRNGKIDDTAKKRLVTSTTTTLQDGSIVTYYSDGSAKVELKDQTIFVRDSNNIKTANGSAFSHTSPSGVALTKEKQSKQNKQIIEFTDGTSLVIDGDEKYIVNKNTKPTVSDNDINYDKNNSFGVVGEKKYKDGNTVTFFENGSAVITDENGNSLYVQKSGDIVQKNQEIYEIITNENGYSRTTKTTPDGKKVTYYDNGAAVIENPDGTRQYVEDNSDIIYDENGNIKSIPKSAQQKNEKETTNGEKVHNFDNGKSQVVKPDGSSYIVDTDKLEFKSNGEIMNDPTEENHNNSTGNSNNNQNPGEGIYVSDAENKYNDFKNIEDTTFIIKNNNNQSKKLRITIEEVENYQKYNTIRLNPKFVKFQATIGDNYIPATSLTSNTWNDSNGVVNYIIYDGTINAKSTQQVALSLYVDYKELTNNEQNKGFIGTIKIYVDG